jgi:hypothetical protein
VWDAFWVLSADRQVGMAVGAIPWSVIDRYAERNGIEDFETFHTLLRAMDNVYLTHANKKAS